MLEVMANEVTDTLGGNLRAAAMWFVIAAIVLVFAVMVLRRGGIFAETLVVVEPGTAEERELKLVTLLPKDAIPAIFDPEFVDAAAADDQLDPRDLVIGVSVGGEHHAYGVAFLSGREVVNDFVGGRPVAVTG